MYGWRFYHGKLASNETIYRLNNSFFHHLNIFVMHLKKITIVLLFLAYGGMLYSQQSDSFYIIAPNRSTSMQIDANEKDVVKTAATIFSNDVKMVSGVGVKIQNKYSTESSYLIVAGTIGTNNLIDSLISTKLVSVNEIINKWEAFKIQVYAPKNSNQKILLVIGNDSRATAYGLMELSRLIGVSPWAWWADVTPKQLTAISIEPTKIIVQHPSVQYRGIFINDEDWGIEPWATKTFEKSVKKGAMGPKAYEKVFELLLRLRANTIWPAMHESTVPFYFVDGNKEMADKYGIVVGTSHCEPMMRCSASEWRLKGIGEYNYAINAQNVDNYWIDRVQGLTASENIYTLGMRGVHDGRMLGATTVAEQVELTNKVIKSQREIISQNLRINSQKVPQVFIPYKEVLAIYNTGKLEVPDDVSLIWCDDNFGYISRLSNPQEQTRSGGSGVYYHVSYYGAPHDYLWLCSTPPAQVYTEMKRAWDYNARKLWILNVGDLKPAEYITEFFLDMAWDIDCVNENSIESHTQNWYNREFGKENSLEIANVMKQYYHLATIRKPEHMGWSRIQTNGFPKGLTPVIDTEFNPFAFGNELQNRIDEYQTLENQVEKLGLKIPANRKDAFFQLVKYPVLGASFMNKKLLYAQMYRMLAPLNLYSANEYAKLSNQAFENIQGLTKKYNQEIADGKWNRMMDYKPRDLPVFLGLELPEIAMPEQQGILVFASGDTNPLQSEQVFDVPAFVESRNNKYKITIYQKGVNKSSWKIAQKPSWVNALSEKQVVNGEENIQLEIDWKRVKRNSKTGRFIIQSGSEKYIFNLNTLKTTPNDKAKAMINDCVAFNANDYQNDKPVDVVEIPNLGHSSMALKIKPGDRNSALEYVFNSTKTGEIKVCVALYPNHPANGRNKRYAIAIDDEEPQEIEAESDIFKENWKVNVLRNQSRTISIHSLKKPGKHILRFYAIDSDIILDQIFVDFKHDRKFYQIPIY